jgi:hypothetical protein
MWCAIKIGCLLDKFLAILFCQGREKVAFFFNFMKEWGWQNFWNNISILRAIRVYPKGRFYFHSFTTFKRAWMKLVCSLCALFFNMWMIWMCISRERMLKLLGTACRRLWQDCWLVLGTRVFHFLQTIQKWWFFPGNMKILRFWCGSVRLHFEMSLNLNIWE